MTPKAARFREALDEGRADRRSVGFVPTMGALHEGHRSLIRRARRDCDLVAVSIFVNPLQFGDERDLATYPRDPDRDAEVADGEGVDLVFAPDVDELYPEGDPIVTIDPGPLGNLLEGAARPGHFRGVCVVVAKLFSLAGPCRAYFGEKDAQQLAIISRMVADLELPVEIVPCPTVREDDGLAMSSRNSHLSPEQRAAAACLSRALGEAEALVREDERNAHVLKAAMARRIGAEPLARLDYVAVVDERTFAEVSEIGSPARALVAAWFGAIRLIDNTSLAP
ncbi:MAG: pantoate--beta-alanine ligase [Actinomycetota bacterium]